MEYKTKVVDGYELIYSSDWIHKIESISHWSYYWHQANLVENFFGPEQNLLEIGIGTGFLTNYLKSRGRKIYGLDIDTDKNPDICADASSFDYTPLNLEGVLAFEIFEHIPLSLLDKVLEKLSSCQVPRILFSVPWNDLRLLHLTLKLLAIPEISLEIRVPRLAITTPAHYWELSQIPRKQTRKELIQEQELRKLFKKNTYEITKLNRVKNIQFYCAELKI